jgi:hypothetical protein
MEIQEQSVIRVVLENCNQLNCTPKQFLEEYCYEVQGVLI